MLQTDSTSGMSLPLTTGIIPEKANLTAGSRRFHKKIIEMTSKKDFHGNEKSVSIIIAHRKKKTPHLHV